MHACTVYRYDLVIDFEIEIKIKEEKNQKGN